MCEEIVSSLCLQEAEAFALYHKALDLQKHDQFEESAKAYHELLEARLLREVRASRPWSQVAWVCPLPSHFLAVTLDTLSLLSAPCSVCVPPWVAVRVE